MFGTVINTALHCSPAAVMITDCSGAIQWVNAAFTEITGYSAGEAIGQTPRLLKSGRQNAAFYEALWGAILSGAPWRGEILNRRKSGELYLSEQTISPVASPAGAITHFVSIQSDITERRRAEETLLRRERDLAEAQRLAGVGSWEWSAETDEVTWSDELYRLIGLDPRSPAPAFRDQDRIYSAESIARLRAAVSEAVATGTGYELALEMIRADGDSRCLVCRGEVVRDEQGRITGLRGTAQDMTERKRAEDALRDTDSALRALLNTTSDSVLLLDSNGTVLIANETVAARLGTTPENMAGGCVFDLLPAEAAEVRKARLLQAIHERRAIHYCDSRAGSSLENCVYPIPDADGRITRAAVYSRDVTEARRAEEALRESERRFRGLLENVGILAVIIDHDWTITFCNDHFLQVTGWSRDELIGANWLERCIPAHERDKLKALFRDSASGGPFPLHYGNSLLTRDGTERWIEWDNSPLRAEDGRLAGTASLGRDLTRQRTLEEQLRQSQKLEAIGRLAGGVAHDFNNLLTVISGYTELLLAEHKHRGPSRLPLEAIRTASQRATELVQQLLAFSRKQMLQPKVLDVGAILHESVKMLHRLIGEHIELTCRSDPALSNIEADPGQIHQVIMNLALNARDAMPNGGTLTIEAANAALDEGYAACHPDVQPGRYVRLTFIDTGCGMDEATRERIFEPFFTTKGVGKGTGLGLSTVYGVVKQSGGHIAVSSQPEHGTTFEVYLPAANRRAARPRRRKAATAQAEGAVLVVEDDPTVRALTADSLRRFGYNVLEAAEGAQALDILRAHPNPIELLVTDVVMPGMGGLELAERIRGLQPEIKVLFVSGYANRPQFPNSLRAAFLPKPYTAQVLESSVRRLLNKKA
ncbi:MAG TPA: PAS domain S-box protein [Bryobacteraceae bacterium]|nr:PAS domain S-box protein [Bryobacteraceae bacterium]